MPNITRGDRMSGLVTYLVGGGRHNEHTEPHLVAGDDALMAWYDDAELSRDSGLAIARHLDRPHKQLGVDVKGGHVWHASLSLRAEEGIKTDAEWNAIATDFVAAMGFDDNDGTKAPCRWVAVRHGLSKAGNDHVHIAVNIVREDGTKASIHLDYVRAQNAARALEVKHGLELLESAKGERATRGYSPAEQAKVEERSALFAQRKYEANAEKIGGDVTPWHQLDPRERQTRITAEIRLNAPRNDLARKVRACASASENEAEFVRRLRRFGVVVRPRYADGQTDVITGYSVAAKPAPGERPIWYGGGHMGRDLTLPRLRAEWPDSATGAMDAAAEWNAAKRNQRPVAPGRETAEPDPELWDRYTAELGELRETLRSVPLDDRDTWARVARQTSGAFAAWSNAVEEVPGDLAAASDELAKSAQTYRGHTKPQKAGRVSAGGAAMLLASAVRGGQGTAAQAAMLRQLMNLTQAVYDAAKAAQQARHAEAIATDVRTRLVRVRAALPATSTTATAATATKIEPRRIDMSSVIDEATREALDKMNRAEENRRKGTTSPLPSTIEPTRPRTTTSPRPDRGPER